METEAISCPIEVTQQELDAIAQCEAIVVREYERPDSSRFGVVIAWGDAEEMQLRADTPEIVMLYSGVSVVCQRMLLVRDALKRRKRCRA